MANVSKNIAHLKASVEETLRKAGRPPGTVQIVLVTKTVPPEKIREAFAGGLVDLGENRAQELVGKQEALQAEEKRYGIRWHMIGHLQTNKVKQVVGRVALIHSLDRPELAEEIERQAQSKKIESVPCLIQVKCSQEVGKFGLAPEAVGDFMAKLKIRAIRIQGLMTIGPNVATFCHPCESGVPESSMDSRVRGNDIIRQAFRNVKVLQERLKREAPQHDWDTLSMGMSGDYKVAIEEGATMIRVGRVVFGEREEQG